MPTEKLELIIDALNYAGAELDELKKDLGGIDQAAGQASKGGLAALKSGWIAASAAAVGFGLAAKKAYDFTKQGAQLELEQERFDRLALSIGTNGEALRADLIPAMRGMMSESEGVAMAAQMMSLGLAQSHEEAVRLTRVASALDMPMNQLVLTLTNMTDMRFDSLNMSVDGFWEKVDKLKQTMSDKDAFRMAFLDQAEGQIDKVGDAADSNVGKIKGLESAVADLINEAKREISPIIIPIVVEVTELIRGHQEVEGYIDQIESAYGQGLISAQERVDMINAGEAKWADSLALIETRTRILSVEQDHATLSSKNFNDELHRGFLEVAGVDRELSDFISTTKMAAGALDEGLGAGILPGYRHWEDLIPPQSELPTVYIPAKLQFEQGTADMGLFQDVPLFQQGDNLAQDFSQHILDMMGNSTQMTGEFENWSNLMKEFNPEMAAAYDTSFAWNQLVAQSDKGLESGAYSAEWLAASMDDMLASIGPTGDAATAIGAALGGLPIPAGQLSAALDNSMAALAEGATPVEALKTGMGELKISGEEWEQAVMKVTEDMQAGVSAQEAIKGLQEEIAAKMEELEKPAELTAEDEATPILEPLVNMVREWTGVHTAYFVAEFEDGGRVPTSTNRGYTPTGGGAFGLDTIVPPSYLNDTAYYAASAGERVQITRPGESAAGGGASDAILRQLAAMIRDLPGEISRSVRDSMLMGV